MPQTIWFQIASTPWWVYVVGSYIIFLSYLGTKQQRVSPRHLALMALYFIVATLGIAIYFKILSPATLTQMLVLLTLGAGTGWLSFSRKNIKVCPETNVLHLPGSWAGIGIIVTLLVIKYYTGYSLVYNLRYYLESQFILFGTLLYAICTGLLLGRLAYARHCVKHGPFLNASVSPTP